MKISLNICWILRTFIHDRQIGQNLEHLSSRSLLTFGGKVQKIFWTQLFGPDQISYHFVSFTNEIFCSAWISQLPTLAYYGTELTTGIKCLQYRTQLPWAICMIYRLSLLDRLRQNVGISKVVFQMQQSNKLKIYKTPWHSA